MAWAVAANGEPALWVALVGAFASLAGVWLGKQLERRTQDRIRRQEESTRQRQSLEEAITQVQLLLIKLDPTTIRSMVDRGLSPMELPGMDGQTTALQAQADLVQDSLIRAGIRCSAEARPLVQRLEDTVREAVEESLVFLALTFKRIGEEARTEQEARSIAEHLRAAWEQTNELRLALGLGHTPVPASLLRGSLKPDGSRTWGTTSVRTYGHSVAEHPQLLELPSQDFESLIAYLFSRMGFRVGITRSTQDSGVDMIADMIGEAMFGRRALVTVKRYVRPVSVATVRDLYGAMLHEAAGGGYLITTSGFTSACYEFAAGKPITLIDGKDLLFLLAEHTGIRADIMASRSSDDGGEEQTEDSAGKRQGTQQ